MNLAPGTVIPVTGEEMLALVHVRPIELSHEIAEELAQDGRTGNDIYQKEMLEPTEPLNQLKKPRKINLKVIENPPKSCRQD